MGINIFWISILSVSVLLLPFYGDANVNLSEQDELARHDGSGSLIQPSASDSDDLENLSNVDVNSPSVKNTTDSDTNSTIKVSSQTNNPSDSTDTITTTTKDTTSDTSNLTTISESETPIISTSSATVTIDQTSSSTQETSHSTRTSQTSTDSTTISPSTTEKPAPTTIPSTPTTTTTTTEVPYLPPPEPRTKISSWAIALVAVLGFFAIFFTFMYFLRKHLLRKRRADRQKLLGRSQEGFFMGNEYSIENANL